MASARVPTSKTLSVGTVLGSLAAGALLLYFLGWGWLRAWLVYPDLSEQQRIEGFNDALVAVNDHGVIARLERGGMTYLGRSDVAQVGASRCVRESECAARGRRICDYVQVTFHCAYAVKDTAGNAAQAIAKFESDPGYSIGVNVAGSPQWLTVGHVSVRETDEKLCELGLGCRPAPGENPGTQAAASPRRDAQASAPPPPETTDCNGVRADIVGKGETCLDPGDPARREFQDCNKGFCGPTMVALPRGRSLRGSSAADMARLLRDNPRATPDWYKNETPQREVTIGHALAVGKFEVTFAAWDACVADGGCTHRPEGESNPARAARPVVDISWSDVTNEFLPWLNRKLGLAGANAYRLLSEAEWEYAARAGTTTKYAFGDIISTAQAQFARAGPGALEVGSFAPNGFGLHDMHGNVAEWVQDCYEGSGYERVPVDGSAHITRPRDCTYRVRRGGGWYDWPKNLRSARREPESEQRRLDSGFRVARTLVVR